jgi:acyl-CoA hydrolase
VDPKPASLSVTEMNEIILPSDSNALGSAFGGKVMQWIDICAAMTAQRHCRTAVVTASMDELHFHAPIRVGMIASLRGEVKATFRRSLEIEVDVHSEDPLTGIKKHCCSAVLTFTALDAEMKPTEVPPLLLETDQQRARQQEALVHRSERLARRKK